MMSHHGAHLTETEYGVGWGEITSILVDLISLFVNVAVELSSGNIPREVSV